MGFLVVDSQHLYRQVQRQKHPQSRCRHPRAHLLMRAWRKLGETPPNHSRRALPVLLTLPLARRGHPATRFTISCVKLNRTVRSRLHRSALYKHTRRICSCSRPFCCNRVPPRSSNRDGEPQPACSLANPRYLDGFLPTSSFCLPDGCLARSSLSLAMHGSQPRDLGTASSIIHHASPDTCIRSTYGTYTRYTRLPGSWLVGVDRVFT